jgi:hypothetical protein
MQHITGIPRNQMSIVSLESSISANNLILFIGAFVENINSKTILILPHKKGGYYPELSGFGFLSQNFTITP